MVSASNQRIECVKTQEAASVISSLATTPLQEFFCGFGYYLTLVAKKESRKIS